MKLTALSRLVLAICTYGVLSGTAFAKKGGGAASSDWDQYLPKVHAACEIDFKTDYDAESLKQHNKDIGWGQTDGGDECNEPLRYAWYACQSPLGKKAIKAKGVRGFRCVGTPGKSGQLFLKDGLLTVSRAFEESKPYVRNLRQFEKIVGFRLALKSSDPYQDHAWRDLRGQPNPVFDKQSYCQVNGKKIEFDPSPYDTFVHRKENAKVSCVKDGKPWIDVVVKDGKVTGFTTYERDDFTRLEHLQDGVAEGEEVVTEKGKLKSATFRRKGQVQWTKEFHPSGKLERYSRAFPKGLKSLAMNEAGNYTEINCSDEVSSDPILAKPCGFQGASTVALYDNDGKVRVTYVYEKGVLQKQAQGESRYAVGSEVEFKDGRKQGLEKVKDSNGKLSRSIHWKDGEKEGEELEFDTETGKLKVRSAWVAGKLRDQLTLHLNGFPQYRETFEGNDKHTQEHYSDEGFLLSRRNFQPCKASRYQKWCAHGVSTRFYEGGKKQEETWENDVLKSVRDWDASGVLVSDRLLEKDGSLKEDRLKSKKTKKQSI